MLDSVLVYGKPSQLTGKVSWFQVISGFYNLTRSREWMNDGDNDQARAS
jgi:hypothetical protein